jgi:hypothetical protein
MDPDPALAATRREQPSPRSDILGRVRKIAEQATDAVP